MENAPKRSPTLGIRRSYRHMAYCFTGAYDLADNFEHHGPVDPEAEDNPL